MFSIFLRKVFCVDVEGSVRLGVGEREIVALNGVGSLTLMSDTNHTFFGIFFNFSSVSYTLHIDVRHTIFLCFVILSKEYLSMLMSFSEANFL